MNPIMTSFAVGLLLTMLTVGRGTHNAILMGAASNEDPTFTTIDFPGATQTSPNEINPEGDIVGFYVSAGVNHGFLLSGDNFTTIDFPGATLTRPRAINP